MMVWPMAPCFGERLHNLRDGRALLADGAVDADQVVLGVVDDGVEQDGGLAGLAVADDELALAAADGDHGVNGLEAGGHGLAHGLAVNDAGGEALDGKRFGGGDGALVVNGHAERVDYAADQGRADRDGENFAGALDLFAFLELGVVAENDGANLILFKREGEAGNAVGEAEQLASHDFVEAVDAGDAVTERGDGADFVDLDLGVVVRDLVAKELRDFVCFDLSHLLSLQFLVRSQFAVIVLRLRSPAVNTSFRRSRRPRTLPS